MCKTSERTSSTLHLPPEEWWRALWHLQNCAPAPDTKSSRICLFRSGVRNLKCIHLSMYLLSPLGCLRGCAVRLQGHMPQEAQETGWRATHRLRLPIFNHFQLSSLSLRSGQLRALCQRACFSPNVSNRLSAQTKYVKSCACINHHQTSTEFVDRNLRLYINI